MSPISQFVAAAALAIVVFGGLGCLFWWAVFAVFERTALYHYPCRGNARRIRYIGISSSPARRDRQHRRRAYWYRETRPMRVIRWYPNRIAAKRGERAAILRALDAGHPLANRVHVPRRLREVRPRGYARVR